MWDPILLIVVNAWSHRVPLLKTLLVKEPSAVRHGLKKAHSPCAKFFCSAHIVTTTMLPSFSMASTKVEFGLAVVKKTFLPLFTSLKMSSSYFGSLYSPWTYAFHRSPVGS